MIRLVPKSEQFLTGFKTKKFSKGEIILCQGEIPECVYIVKKGVVKSYNINGEGVEKPIMFDIRGEVLPVGWVFRKFSASPYFYEAYTNVEAYVLPRDEYLQHLYDEPRSMQKALSDFASRYAVHQMRINALEQSSATQKVISTLHFMCMRFGRTLKKDLVRIELPLTQQELANFMGLTRETTGIELKKLKTSKVISYRRKLYTVKTNQLNNLLDDDYDSWRLSESSALSALV